MRVDVFCSDRRHHSWAALELWAESRGAFLTDDIDELRGGDLLVLVSCTQYVERAIRNRYGRALVIHESDLPEGRGWSPLAWQIIAGRNAFTVSLIEAADSIDAGDVLAKEKFSLEGHELSAEINDVRDAVRIRLLDFAVENPDAKAVPQAGMSSKYDRRTPEDSRLDPQRSIASQFDLLRICEPRFPAFFELRGHRYEISLRKVA